MEEIIVVENLNKSYQHKSAVNDLSFTVCQGEIVGLLVWSFVAVLMVCGTILMYGIFTLSEIFFPLVPDQLSAELFIRVFFNAVLCLFLSLFIGLVSARIGFIKKSVQTTIIVSVVLCSGSANVIATMSYSYIPFIVLFSIALLLAFISYRGLRIKIEHAEV